MRQTPIAETLKQWRTVRALSQRALAERAGIGYVIIARLELGQTDPRLSTLTKLAEALEIDLVGLMTGPPRHPNVAPSTEDLRALRLARQEHARGHYASLDHVLTARAKRPTRKPRGRK